MALMVQNVMEHDQNIYAFKQAAIAEIVTHEVLHQV